MFGALSKVFGGDSAGKSIIDGVTNAVDKLVYTGEEKAEDAAKAKQAGFEVYMAWLKSTSGSRLARRMIATLVVGVWVVEHLASVVLTLVSMRSCREALVNNVCVSNEQVQKAAEFLSQTATDNSALVGVVLLFYFGGPVASDTIVQLIGRWTGLKRRTGDREEIAK